ncbi:MAG: cytochrome, partial [Actinomycetia bacterium]|nr:cytochrome [Actinomycetes bacterium]
PHPRLAPLTRGVSPTVRAIGAGNATTQRAVFTDADRFEILRDAKDHVGFGGPGPHFCLGAHLARREITVMFRELFAQLPGIRATGEPDRLLSNFINGIKRLPYAGAPARALRLTDDEREYIFNLAGGRAEPPPGPPHEVPQGILQLLLRVVGAQDLTGSRAGT